MQNEKHLRKLWRRILATPPARNLEGYRVPGCCNEWYRYEDFKKHVPMMVPGKIFTRPNRHAPYSPRNFVWVTQQEFGFLHGRNNDYNTISPEKAYRASILLLSGFGPAEIGRMLDCPQRSISNIKTNKTFNDIKKQARTFLGGIVDPRYENQLFEARAVPL